MKTQNIVSAAQTAREGYQDYQMRDERLSRKCAFGATQAENAIHLCFCITLAVNGLSDRGLRLKLCLTMHRLGLS